MKTDLVRVIFSEVTQLCMECFFFLLADNLPLTVLRKVLKMVPAASIIQLMQNIKATECLLWQNTLCLHVSSVSSVSFLPW